MSTVVYKYGLTFADRQVVALPAGAQPLYAVEQYGQIVMYAHVDADALYRMERVVWIHGTGHPTQFSTEAKALGVVSLAGGGLMMHVFIEPEA